MDADLDLLDIAIDGTDQVIAAIADTQLSLPTPCSEWDVRDLIGHLVTGNEGFAAALRGDAGAPAAGVPQSAAGLLDAYRSSGAQVAEGFRRPGVLTEPVTVPFGTVPGTVALHLRLVDLLVHGWDLATATGRSVSFPADLVEQALAFTRAALADMPPERRPFGPSQAVADDAPALDRLVAARTLRRTDVRLTQPTRRAAAAAPTLVVCRIRGWRNATTALPRSLLPFGRGSWPPSSTSR